MVGGEKILMDIIFEDTVEERLDKLEEKVDKLVDLLKPFIGLVEFKNHLRNEISNLKAKLIEANKATEEERAYRNREQRARGELQRQMMLQDTKSNPYVKETENNATEEPTSAASGEFHVNGRAIWES